MLQNTLTFYLSKNRHKHNGKCILFKAILNFQIVKNESELTVFSFLASQKKMDWHSATRIMSLLLSSVEYEMHFLFIVVLTSRTIFLDEFNKR